MVQQPSRDEVLSALREALESYDPAAGTGLFDAAAEERKAKVRNRALNLLDHRARFRSELRTRLLGLEFDEDTVEEVLDDLQGTGLLNDELFAREWVRSRAQRRGKSRMVLNRELQQKGVGPEHRAQALAQISDDDEEARARAIAQKKARSLRSIPETYEEQQKELRKIVGMLARRGFNQGMSLRIARVALNQRVDELENL